MGHGPSSHEVVELCNPNNMSSAEVQFVIKAIKTLKMKKYYGWGGRCMGQWQEIACNGIAIALIKKLNAGNYGHLWKAKVDKKAKFVTLEPCPNGIRISYQYKDGTFYVFHVYNVFIHGEPWWSKPEIEETTPLGTDLVQDDSKETVAKEEVQPEAEVILSITETLEMLRSWHLTMLEPTYVIVGASVFKVCKDREAKAESGQKPDSEDKDRAIGTTENLGVPKAVTWGHIRPCLVEKGFTDLPKLKDEQVENPTNETSLENVKNEEEAQMEIKETKNAHSESNVTTGLEAKESIKVKDDKKTKLEPETVEKKAKPRIEDETTTTAKAEVYMTPESTWSMHSSQFKNLLFISSTESTWSTDSSMSKGSKGSNESKGSKRSTRFNRCTGSIGTKGSTEPKLEVEENIVLETKM